MMSYKFNKIDNMSYMSNLTNLVEDVRTIYNVYNIFLKYSQYNRSTLYYRSNKFYSYRTRASPRYNRRLNWTCKYYVIFAELVRQ